MRCAFPKCEHDSSQNSSPRISFYRFPEKESFRKAWLEAFGQMNWEPEPGSIICSKHCVNNLDCLMIPCDVKINVELVQSDREVNKPFSSDSENNPNSDNFGFDYEDLEEVNKSTDKSNTTLKDDVHIKIVKVESNNVIYNNHNSEDITNDMTISKVKTEIDDLNNNDDLNTCSSNFNDDINRDVNDEVILTKSLVYSAELPEDSFSSVIKIEYNDEGSVMANVKKSFSPQMECQPNVNDDINQDINDEVIPTKSLVYSAELPEDSFGSVIKMEYNDEGNLMSNVEKSFSPHMECRPNFYSDINRDVNDEVIPTKSLVYSVELPEDSFSSVIKIEYNDEGNLMSNVEKSFSSHMECRPNFNNDINRDVNGEVTPTKSLVYSVELPEDSFSSVIKIEYNDEGSVMANVKKSFSPQMECRPNVNDDINQDINDEVIPTKSLVYSAELPEDSFGSVIKTEYNDEGNLMSNVEKSFSSHMECRPPFISEDINTLRIKKQQTLEADSGQSLDDKERKKFKTHSSEEPNSCNVCKRVFKFKGSIKNHMRIHTGEKPYSCNVCKKSFTLKHNLRQHYSTKHSDEKPYSCDICKKAFGVKANLQQHIKIHSSVKPYPCDFCEKTFWKKQHQRLHLITHTGQNPYSCDICKQGFRHKHLLKSHLLKKCSENQYICDICKRVFRHKEQLLPHLLIHSGVKPYSCAICRKAFKHQYLLKSHLLLHSGENHYLCNICQRAFRHKEQLLSHLPKHSGEKPYSCNTCNKAFRKQYLLKSHLQIHSDEKPHSCLICKKSFRKKDQLQKHSRTHSSVKPYSCDTCGNSFLHQYLLNSHSLIHTGEKPYSCNICKKAFRLKRVLTKHLITHSTK